MTNIITGEKLQEIADVYLTCQEKISSNPYIFSQMHKNKMLCEIKSEYDNPKIVFCYPDILQEFSEKLVFFKNTFVLITHNSDINIIEDSTTTKIANHEKIIKWYAQNVCFSHEKLLYLPIGIANRQWQHGSQFVEFYEKKCIDFENIVKKGNSDVYFNFNIHTNSDKRQQCYNNLVSKGLPFLPNIDNWGNLSRLLEYKFCICPEGNGIDTHRFWEALYLKCIPIVICNPLIDIIQKQEERENKGQLPMIVLTSWDDLNINSLPDYESFEFSSSMKYLNYNCIKDSFLCQQQQQQQQQPKKIFITFGGPTQNFYNAVDRVCQQAREFNLFDEVIGFTDKDLKNDAEFWEKNGAFIENHKRGYGYWIWKSYINFKTIQRMDQGDIVVYVDSGCELRIQFIERMKEYFDIVTKSDKGIIGMSLCFNERHWTKMDTFVKLDCTEFFNDGYQVIGGIVIYKKCENTCSIIEKWYNGCCNHHLITDAPSVLPNAHDFIEHRHDQSIFSLLMKKHGFERLGYEIEEQQPVPIYAARNC